MSVTTEGGVKYSETMEGGRPKLGGLMDPRQGTIDSFFSLPNLCWKYDGMSRSFRTHRAGKTSVPRRLLKMIIKSLRCVCFYCSKLLVDGNNPKVKDVLSKSQTQPLKRLQHIYDLCKGKRICEGGDMVDDKQSSLDIDEAEKKMSHGGCGRNQPQIRRSGLELTAEWKEVNEDSQEKKIPLTAERVHEIF
ncbi:hypothetical protein OS493_037212 [Desmophyllum pertusum]|uniref:DNA-directed RNA polymerase n=1 Tax=Desmophyllum pertusum TaxID=174260 RepID=A0A9X0CHT5_9CNID|nr:hypothetical protein OS493_037212 [Desmophyllum pertusum]